MVKEKKFVNLHIYETQINKCLAFLINKQNCAISRFSVDKTVSALAYTNKLQPARLILDFIGRHHS